MLAKALPHRRLYNHSFLPQTVSIWLFFFISIVRLFLTCGRRNITHSGHELAVNKVWYLADAGEQLDMDVTPVRAQGALLKRKPEIT